MDLETPFIPSSCHGLHFKNHCFTVHTTLLAHCIAQKRLMSIMPFHMQEINRHRHLLAVFKVSTNPHLVNHNYKNWDFLTGLVT